MNLAESFNIDFVAGGRVVPESLADPAFRPYEVATQMRSKSMNLAARADRNSSGHCYEDDI